MGCLQGTVQNRAKEDADGRLNRKVISSPKSPLFNKIPNSILQNVVFRLQLEKHYLKSSSWKPEHAQVLLAKEPFKHKVLL